MNRSARIGIVLGLAAAPAIGALLAAGQTRPSPEPPLALASTPPMGWNSWNHFHCGVSDAIVRAQAAAMAAGGMKAAGYLYVNIDDCWEGQRDAEGNIHPNAKFPDMKALADYVHGLGLKLGIYSSPGPETCAHYAGSYGHEAQDARTYAGWGIDYLKYDLCSFRTIMRQAAGPDAAHQLMLDAYTKMHDALAATGRSIVFSLCQYGVDRVWSWGASVGGNLWRTTGDITDRYDRMSLIGFGRNGLERFAGPGHWNDPDMLEVGNGGMNRDEYETHMSLWCLLAAPLIAGNDLTAASPETLALLTNPEVVAVDQDPAGVQGRRVWQEGPLEIWMKPMADRSRVAGLFNRGESPATMTVRFDQIGAADGARVRDLWQRRDQGRVEDSYSATVPRHGVVLLRIYD